MNGNSLFVLVGALALVGCDDLGGDDKDTGLDTDSGEVIESDETDVVETDVTSPPPSWNEDFWAGGWEDFVDCSEGEVTLAARTTGFGYDTELYITQTTDFGGFDAWGEMHTMEETNAGGSGATAFSHYERTLDTFASLGTQTTDVSTLFLCDQDDPGGEDRGFLDPVSAEFEATFALAVWDEDGDAGIDAPSDCVVFGQDADGLLADPTSNDRIDVPSWLTDANCRVVE